MTRVVRRRYLALNVDSDEPLEPSAVSDAIWNAVLRLFGEVGASQAGLYTVRSDREKNLIVLRCSHKALPMVRASVASITNVDGKPAAIHVSRVSGTLKALSRKVAGSPQES
jgi:RNase P/RNase MRP subunit POP5